MTMNFLWNAAVLILEVAQKGDQALFLIKRSESVPTHKGQYAFPGGHRHPGEDSPVEVALREFEEETSCSQSNVEIIETLPPFSTGLLQNTLIPVRGRWKGGPFSLEKVISNGEWDRPLLLPTTQLKDNRSWGFGNRLTYHEQNGRWEHLPIYFHFLGNGEFIWGITGAILWKLKEMRAI